MYKKSLSTNNRHDIYTKFNWYSELSDLVGSLIVDVIRKQKTTRDVI